MALGDLIREGGFMDELRRVFRESARLEPMLTARGLPAHVAVDVAHHAARRRLGISELEELVAAWHACEGMPDELRYALMGVDPLPFRDQPC